VIGRRQTVLRTQVHVDSERRLRNGIQAFEPVGIGLGIGFRVGGHDTGGLDAGPDLCEEISDHRVRSAELAVLHGQLQQIDLSQTACRVVREHTPLRGRRKHLSCRSCAVWMAVILEIEEEERLAFAEQMSNLNWTADRGPVVVHRRDVFRQPMQVIEEIVRIQ
jgi:hypothetical protein